MNPPAAPDAPASSTALFFLAPARADPPTTVPSSQPFGHKILMSAHDDAAPHDGDVLAPASTIPADTLLEAQQGAPPPARERPRPPLITIPHDPLLPTTTSRPRPPRRSASGPRPSPSLPAPSPTASSAVAPPPKSTSMDSPSASAAPPPPNRRRAMPTTRTNPADALPPSSPLATSWSIPPSTSPSAPPPPRRSASRWLRTAALPILPATALLGNSHSAMSTPTSSLDVLVAHGLPTAPAPLPDPTAVYMEVPPGSRRFMWVPRDEALALIAGRAPPTRRDGGGGGGGGAWEAGMLHRVARVAKRVSTVVSTVLVGMNLGLCPLLLTTPAPRLLPVYTAIGRSLTLAIDTLLTLTATELARALSVSPWDGGMVRTWLATGGEVPDAMRWMVDLWRVGHWVRLAAVVAAWGAETVAAAKRPG
ncbi:hypothetical protein AMAG_00245 [Allomyces macrogynus ATCC 38327]|uniref:Uncharacterized protein n=1 Tax=Allomyces macrogynus (strain ATCC 38327) TaxID=578462 RepID=A0A0L0RVA9_ALLM3|nr:hypothetical protein AMAG_00245 [Allomyces macrogynus ATCC 38327]|eukprot:KNE54253.1 hypothetical protein AMAG_00245 [Allomyces macrogynus ATCC 38327]